MASLAEIAAVYPRLRRLIRHPDDQDALHDWILIRAPKIATEGLVFSAARWLTFARMKRDKYWSKRPPLNNRITKREDRPTLELDPEKMARLTKRQREVVEAVERYGDKTDTELFMTRTQVMRTLHAVQERLKKR